MKNVLRELLREKSEDKIKQFIESHQSFDLSKMFFALNDEEKELFLSYASDELIADILSHNPEESGEILLDLDHEKRTRVIDELELDDVVDILSELNEEEQKEIIEDVDIEDLEDIKNLLEYKEDEVGAHMSTEYIQVNYHDDVKVATAKLISEAKNTGNISTIFVTNNKKEYKGTIYLNNLLKARSPLVVSELIDNNSATLDNNSIEHAVNDMKNYSLPSMPVTDDKGRLVGIITLDDAIEVLKDSADEDLKRLTGISAKHRSNRIITQSLKRLPWLVIFLGLSLIIAFVTGLFEEMLIFIPMLMIFQPLVLDAGGDIGSQTLGITLNLLQKRSKKIKRNVINEILTGLIIGLLEGILAFGITILFGFIMDFGVNIYLIAIVVGLSLCITIILAPIVAIVIPLFLKLIKLDPAIASGAFITTIIDIGSLVIYFLLATLLLGGAM